MRHPMLRRLLSGSPSSLLPPAVATHLGGLICLLLLIAPSHAGAQNHAGALNIYWVDVEGGAATLIVTPLGESVLIDSGNPGQRDPQRIVRVATQVAGLRRIDHLITTHYHRDHFGGAATLAKLIPIGQVHDNGRFAGMPDDPGKEYWNFPCAARRQLQPGDEISLRQPDLPLRLVCLAARKKFVSNSKAPQNPAAGKLHRPKERDGSDNANSVAMLLEYAGFRFLDNGDLTWNQEVKLVHPQDLIGEVDVYQVTHHGLESSNNPALLNTVRPTVSVMNNGVTKGCAPEVFANLSACDSIKAMYQVHKNHRPDGAVNNVPDEFIANRKRDKCDANYIHLQLSPDGKTYDISIPAHGHQRSYQTRRPHSTSAKPSDATDAADNAAAAASPASASPPAAVPVGHDEQVLLWPAGSAAVQGDKPTDLPALTVHLPDPEKSTGAAVIVNPGGGYHVLAADHEGLQVARELNRRGIAAFVLRYRLRPYKPADALRDGQRAVRYVRHHAKHYRLDPRRIGMAGFSAGGHLCSAVGTAPGKGNPDAADPIDRASARPDFLVLVYPAIAGELFGRPSEYPSTHSQVTAETPPSFLVHTHEDFLSPNHSIAFYQALLKAKVQAELHVFGYGPHGTGVAPGDPILGRWPQMLEDWLRRSGMLTSATRHAAEGTVSVDGKPLFWGWLTLIPEQPHAPTVTAYIEWNRPGAFKLDAAHGPVLGKYRAEVRRVAKHFDDKKGGSYSLADAELIGSVPVTISEENLQQLQINVSP